MTESIQFGTLTWRHIFETVSQLWQHNTYFSHSSFPLYAIVANRQSILKCVKDFQEHGNVTPKILRRVPHVVYQKIQHMSKFQSPQQSTRHRTQPLRILQHFK